MAVTFMPGVSVTLVTARGSSVAVPTAARHSGAAKVTDPACRGAAYLRPNATALDLWYGVYLANLLASSGVFVPQIVDAAPPAPDAAPASVPNADSVDRDKLLAALGRDPSSPFGSNATAIGGDSTTTGKGMLLGNPHFPWRGRYRFTQQQLTIPGSYDVAGASLVGYGSGFLTDAALEVALDLATHAAASVLGVP